ncbi:MAG: hypothetical protein Q8J88_00815 [Bacteroidales bacterium]|nr:hypothetical protein [Bacteroidales bacterium]
MNSKLIKKSEVNRNLSDIWLKASVIGSIWAAFEIIIGSFLHNLRIPFAGMFLAAASVFLLVAFHQLWNEKGIILRAGIICALMKSISPSAIILGPMVGIFMEAILIESTVVLFRRTVFGYILSGILAVIWTLTQKIINLIILYGFDLIRIAASFIEYLSRQFQFFGDNRYYIFIGVICLYALLGGLAAFAGLKSGNYYLKNKQTRPFEKIPLQDYGSQLFNIQPSHQYSFFNLFGIISAIIIILWLMNSGHVGFAYVAGVGLLMYCAIRYKNALRHLKKPIIWLQFVAVTLTAAFFWEYLSTGLFYSTKGLQIGLEMNFRALIIIFGFSAVSVELRNPLIRLLLSRNGFSQLYSALSLSFSVLPAVMNDFPRTKDLLYRRKRLTNHIFSTAEDLLATLERSNFSNE